MDFANSNVFSQKLKEFYWTVTRAVGLGFLHDGSRNGRNPADVLPARGAAGQLDYIQVCPHLIDTDPDAGALFRSVWETYARAPAAPGDPVNRYPVGESSIYSI